MTGSRQVNQNILLISPLASHHDRNNKNSIEYFLRLLSSLAISSLLALGKSLKVVMVLPQPSQTGKAISVSIPVFGSLPVSLQYEQRVTTNLE